jgi:hypothetical protein
MKRSKPVTRTELREVMRKLESLSDAAMTAATAELPLIANPATAPLPLAAAGFGAACWAAGAVIDAYDAATRPKDPEPPRATQ